MKKKCVKISEWGKINFYLTQMVWGIFRTNWEAPISSLAFLITCILCPSTAVHILQTHPDSVVGVKCCSLYLQCLTLWTFFSSLLQSLEDQAKTPLFLYIIFFSPSSDNWVLFHTYSTKWGGRYSYGMALLKSVSTRYKDIYLFFQSSFSFITFFLFCLDGI